MAPEGTGAGSPLGAFDGKRALVAGGAGFIGVHLCAELLALGATVVCVDSEITSVSTAAEVPSVVSDAGSRYQFVKADVRDSLCLPAEFDYVFNLASIASPKWYRKFPLETLQAGSLGVMRTLDICRRSGARYVFSSTSEVYGEPLEHPQKETYRGNVDPVGPRSAYDESKRFAEAYLAASRGIELTDIGIARIFNTYGPRMRADDGRVVSEFIQAAIEGAPLRIYGNGSQTRSFMYIEDCVRGLLLIALSEEFGPFNLGSAEEISIFDLARLIIELSQSDSAIRFLDRSADDPSKRMADSSRLFGTTGWQPSVALTAGLNQTIDWYRSQSRK